LLCCPVHEFVRCTDITPNTLKTQTADLID
jgi:hypothetical protein